MQTFDPNAFLDLPIDAPLERRSPLPAQDYLAIIQDVNARQWQSQSKTTADGSPKTGIVYDVALAVQIPPGVKAASGLTMDTLQLRDSIMLDLHDKGGINTAPGFNRGLRTYREALDMNKPGEVFRARAMVGRLIRVRIKHEEYQGNLQERVDGVSKAQ